MCVNHATKNWNSLRPNADSRPTITPITSAAIPALVAASAALCPYIKMLKNVIPPDIKLPTRNLPIGPRVDSLSFLAAFIFAERQRSATRVLGAGRASARTVTSIRVGCSAWLALFDRANEAFIFAMVANPEPNKVFAVFDRQCADRKVHSC